MSEAKVDIREALRYLRADPENPETRRMAEEMATLLEKSAPPRYVFREVTVERGKTEEGLLLPEAGLRLEGKLAERRLRGCGKAILMACTLGAAYERLERTWRVRDLARAAVLDACGSALTEAGCEAAEAEIRKRYPGKILTERFSPGYGDLPLALQVGLLRALNAEKRLGITLTESLLMVPSKSVTAIIGLAEAPLPPK